MFDSSMLKKILKVAFFLPFFLLGPYFAYAQPQHGIALYGSPKLAKDFTSLPYADPSAPSGGRITFGKRGRFDSFNPFITKGRAPSEIRTHIFESLMARSWDEPFSLYGLLAESIDVTDDSLAVTFVLRAEAKFADGTPVTPDDVIFSMEILRTLGRPNFRSFYSRISRAVVVGQRGVRFEFASPERELPMLIGLMPIHSRAATKAENFAETTFEKPIASGPYEIKSYEAGAQLTLKKRDDYWGVNLPINQGVHNFDEITYLYFKDESALWEAFKAGVVDIREENNFVRWASGYDFPAFLNGHVERVAMPHSRATGMYGFVFNTRKAVFDDRKVREALTLAFDFEWVNEALNQGIPERITSYYANSRLAHKRKAMGIERELLLPYINFLPTGTLEGDTKPPTSSGDGRNRSNLRRASQLLQQVGLVVDKGVLRNGDGVPFEFEILLDSGSDQRAAAIFARSLQRLGIQASLRQVDDAQYQARLNIYDYDMILRRWWLSLSPGTEQEFYFGSDGVHEHGTRNYMGAYNPAIDGLIAKILSTDEPDVYVAAVRALDRVLSAEQYVIPLWYDPKDRIAWWKPLEKPEAISLYGNRSEVWWIDSD